RNHNRRDFLGLRIDLGERLRGAGHIDTSEANGLPRRTCSQGREIERAMPRLWFTTPQRLSLATPLWSDWLRCTTRGECLRLPNRLLKRPSSSRLRRWFGFALAHGLRGPSEARRDRRSWSVARW